MKKIFTLFSAIVIGTVGFGQVVFQSDLSSWSGGNPTDFMGSATNIPGSSVWEQTVGVTYGTSMASLINTTASHQRFTTQNVSVVAGQAYEIKMWVAGSMGSLRTGFYDATNAAYNTYNPYLNMAVESAGNLVMLTQTVTVPATCTSGQFIFSLHSTDPTYAGAPFYLGIILDSVAVTAVTLPPPTLVDIYDIQYTTDISGDSPETGNIVTTRGVVTGVIGFGADAGRFFIQDGSGPWTGIYVYDTTPVTLGDSVEVTGTITEYFGLTEFTSVSAVTIISSGNPQPIATDVSTLNAAQEQYECVLVKVSDAICNNPSAGFGTFIVNDGSGDRIVDDQIYTYVPVLGNAYDITGVTFLSFSEVKIYPRIAADIVTTGYASVEENIAFSIYPNPATSSVKLNVQADALVTIYALTGELIYQGIGNGLIDVTNFSKGLYQVVVTQNEITSTQKLIIQ